MQAAFVAPLTILTGAFSSPVDAHTFLATELAAVLNTLVAPTAD